MHAKLIRNVIELRLGDINKLTIGEVLMLKNVLRLTNSEAVNVFLGGVRNENI